MPAGRMYLTAKAVPRKTFRRRATGFKKVVTAIAKKAVMTAAETKTRDDHYSSAFGVNGALWTPNGGGMFSSIIQGTGQGQRIGDEIQSLGVRIRGYISINNTVITAGYQHCAFRMVLAAGKRPLTSGDLPQFRGAVDPEVLTIVSDRMVKLSSTNYGLAINKYIKFKRNVKFQGNVTTKNDLYLWLIPNPDSQTGLTTTSGYVVNVQLQTYYKDV